MPFADVAALAAPAHAAVAPVAATPWKTVTVRPGDTLWQLAITNHTTVQALVEKNRLARGGSDIRPGQKLLVPGRAAAAPTGSPSKGATPTRPGARSASSAASPVGTIYVVRAGDS